MRKIALPNYLQFLGDLVELLDLLLVFAPCLLALAIVLSSFFRLGKNACPTKTKGYVSARY
ncbi:MAG: hypothetical protein IKM16_01130, partial [Clostridia bacterium]|nr:hypothetical protein [Clostridia bacterium]